MVQVFMAGVSFKNFDFPVFLYYQLLTKFQQFKATKGEICLKITEDLVSVSIFLSDVSNWRISVAYHQTRQAIEPVSCKYFVFEIKPRIQVIKS